MRRVEHLGAVAAAALKPIVVVGADRDRVVRARRRPVGRRAAVGRCCRPPWRPARRRSSPRDVVDVRGEVIGAVRSRARVADEPDVGGVVWVTRQDGVAGERRVHRAGSVLGDRLQHRPKAADATERGEPGTSDAGVIVRASVDCHPGGGCGAGRTGNWHAFGAPAAGPAVVRRRRPGPGHEVHVAGTELIVGELRRDADGVG